MDTLGGYLPGEHERCDARERHLLVEERVSVHCLHATCVSSSRLHDPPRPARDVSFVSTFPPS